MKPSWPLLLISLLPAPALGAACCGGGFAAPSMIAGDDKAQVSASFSHTQIQVDNVDSGGIWRKSSEHQRVQTLRLEGAHLLSDRWQAGVTVPVIRRSHIGKAYSGLGDLSSSIAYEYLPDWDYNPYRPKGLGYLQITYPTGRPRADSEVGGLDSRGNGFWAVGLGTLLTKAFGSFDAFLTFEAHRSFARKISNSLSSGRLKPGFGGNGGVGGGFNTKSWRIGGSLIWSYEEPVSLEGRINAHGTLERYATAAASVTFLASDAWSATLTYSDQTLFGSPLNTSLGRTGLISLQRRWAR